MGLSINRQRIDERLQEVRSLLSFIRANESTQFPPADSDEVKIARGLFFVHLYGAYEKSLNDCFQSYLRALNAVGFDLTHFEPRIWPAALDARFSSLQSPSEGNAWQRRAKFVEAFTTGEPCTIPDTLFGSHLANATPEKVQQIISWLGLTPFPFAPEDIQGLVEVSEKRNAVAHGRISPRIIGQQGRSPDLEVRINNAIRFIDCVCINLALQFSQLTYVRPPHHPAYLPLVA
ncbi:HEPN domain-containing protein [Achromobacter mucicolens]|uniref:HEPN domain-containing protein n=1 Tax=Achromobacter mucicolens TaxID=1389922 RepID=UPI00397591C3